MYVGDWSFGSVVMYRFENVWKGRRRERSDIIVNSSDLGVVIVVGKESNDQVKEVVYLRVGQIRR